VPAGWAQVCAWSAERGGRLKPTHGRDGLAVEPDLASAPARLEWGPSQRRYLGPGELRWLAMSPKLSAQQLGVLAQDYAAVSNVGAWVADWLGGALGPTLLACAEAGSVGANWPLALILQRGRLVLRAALPTADRHAIARYFDLFSLALTAARRLPRCIEAACLADRRMAGEEALRWR